VVNSQIQHLTDIHQLEQDNATPESNLIRSIQVPKHNDLTDARVIIQRFLGYI